MIKANRFSNGPSLARTTRKASGALLLLAASLLCSGAASAVPATIALPACGGDPSANTRMLQAALNDALAGDTVVMPPGVCLVAKCDLAAGSICAGLSGPHRSALYEGGKAHVTLKGASDGTSVIKLDPKPPGSPGHHGYCGDAHVFTLHRSHFVTLRGFTVDGSDAELPHEKGLCPPDGEGNPRGLAEHLHGVQVLNSTDIFIDRMKIVGAHGDGVNLIAERADPVPATERVHVSNSQFLANDRSGVAFQRNVGFVTVRSNLFRNSGNDQDLDMEPSGNQGDVGPHDVTIDNNMFERTQARIAVTLGGKGVLQGRRLWFTNNTIKPYSPATSAGIEEGGCVFVYNADQVTITGNTIIGARVCPAVGAQRTTNLVLEGNHLVGYANPVTSSGRFEPVGVIDVRDHVVKTNGPDQCLPETNPPCTYFVHYSDRLTIRGNEIVQQVRQAPGITLRNVDLVEVFRNTLRHTQRVEPIGEAPAEPRSAGAELRLGLPGLRAGQVYENERTLFRQWVLDENTLRDFDDGVRVKPQKAGVRVLLASLSKNTITTTSEQARGLVLAGADEAPEAGYFIKLGVAQNRFACGFPPPLPPNAFLRPVNQLHIGNIGSVIACQ